LKNLVANPGPALQELEEHVNDGSPSGFSAVNQPSWPFRCGSGADPFPLYACVTRPPASARDFFDVPPLPGLPGRNWIYVHPDVRGHPDLRAAGLSVRPLDAPLVRPTASGRTVAMVDEPGWHLKLGYPGLLGRVDRAMPQIKAVAGPEISREIENAIHGARLRPALQVLPEVGARVISTEAGRTWGQIIRARDPFGRPDRRAHAIVPIFSLFSTDRRNTSHPSLLAQLLNHWGPDAELHLHDVLQELVACYFSLVRCLGLQPEYNAQNVLLALDSEGRPTGVVLRDLMGTEKDLTLREQLGLPTNFASAPYKCVSRDADEHTYQIRHSLAYDFKVGEYVLAPLIREAAAADGRWSVGELTTLVRSFARSQLADLPDGYLPSGAWYRHPKVVHNHEHLFERMSGPRFR
jgi:hypothetical protein